METKPLSLEEQEQKEMESLSQKFSQLNKTFKKRDKKGFVFELNKLYLESLRSSNDDSQIKEFYKCKRAMSYEILNNFQIENNIFNNFNQQFYSSYLKKESVKNDFFSTSDNSIENLFYQNIDINQTTIKICVIGEKATGKTTLIHKIIYPEKDLPQEYLESDM